jgi:TRAP-type mannitol/chloroaromatic compound transport system permease large subunit
METNALGKYTTSFGMSLAITSLVSAVLVVVKEMSENTVLALMKRITFHHWFTHTLFVLILFVVLGWVLARANGGQGVNMTVNRFVSVLVGAVVLSGIIIAGFYLIWD